MAKYLSPIPRNPPKDKTAYAIRPDAASSTRSSIFPRSSFCALTTLLPITVFFAGTISVYLAVLGSAMLFSLSQRKLVDSPYFPRKRKQQHTKAGRSISVQFETLSSFVYFFRSAKVARTWHENAKQDSPGNHLGNAVNLTELQAN